LQQNQLQKFLTDKADDMKAENIVTLDVKDKSSLTDYMIICTGSSKKHVTSIAHHIALEAKKLGISPLGMEGEVDGEWVVLDMGSSVFHIMQEEPRNVYQLEKLWS